ncbi:hydantoinase B/oxoprolinase family protein [Acidisoma cellulosilytica]|uniref:Hydantoinase B/oxoprolinase family protein n=1 Tax=Acidisoma cellulosilyticum TaxID=2802395 RepID=A0A963Z731_9PROT|nr:hydantoinase B/oxoprolinase family protein [Acidisoma cellulosilyticum]MCB8883704.1 hydantoinase B/oxoprolinase family protein [Acidisoma cellulosilyticum]
MIDPVTVAVVGSVLKALIGETGDALRRSSHSPIIRDMLDYSCALFNAQGEAVAEDANIPALLGSMTYSMPHLLAENPTETVFPGDVFIGNDPYRGCTHTLDIHIFAPVFAEGRVVAWIGNLAHHNDIGGTNPGTEGFANRSIYEEGLRFPWVKLVEQGRENTALVRYFENNTRDPIASLGDLRAQIAAARLGVRRMADVVGKFGVVTLEAAMAERLAQSERRIRRVLAETPDGAGFAEGFLDNDGIGSEPVRIAVSVAVAADELVVDFTGTDPQMAGGMNCSRTATLAGVIFAVKAAFDPDADQTAGSLRALRVILPERTAVNPVYPAAVSLRHLAAQRVTDTIVRAMTGFKPDLAVAGGFVGFSSLAAECRHPRTGLPVIMADDLGGGMGGNRLHDGLSAVDPYLGNVGILPMEVCERQYPIRILTTALEPDSGGCGAHRGGLAIRRVYQFLDRCDVVFYTEQTRAEFAAWGASGGKAGAPARLVLERADGTRLPITKNRLMVEAGDRLVTVTGGGGGWGDPAQRPAARLAQDLREGKISREAATACYNLAAIS